MKAFFASIHQVLRLVAEAVGEYEIEKAGYTEESSISPKCKQ